MQAPGRRSQLRRWNPLKSLLLLQIAGLLLAPPVMADDTEEVLIERFAADGHYGVVASGVGMLQTVAPGPGTIEIDVPGTSVRTAYLYWSGYGTADTGDCTVTLRRDTDGQTITVTAEAPDGVHGPLFWYDGFYYWSHVAEVTPLIAQGLGTYTISDFGGQLHRRDGAGLIVVYEDPKLPLSHVVVRDGLDRMYRRWGEGPRGESAVNCAQVGNHGNGRSLAFWMFAAEVVRYGEEEPRPNALWYLTGNGGMPADLINAPSDGPVTGRLLQGPPDEYPFASRDGLQWDTYHNQVTVPPGHTWVCLQVESANDPRDPAWKPASGILLALAASVGIQELSTQTPSPTAQDTPTPPPTKPGITTTVVPEASSLLFLASSATVLAGYAALQWRARRRD
jgi:hypothetical protein